MKIKKLTPSQQELLADLAGGSELADALGISRALLAMWINRYDDFPEPVLTVAAGRFWRKSEVLAWAPTRGEQ